MNVWISRTTNHCFSFSLPLPQKSIIIKKTNNGWRWSKSINFQLNTKDVIIYIMMNIDNTATYVRIYSLNFLKSIHHKDNYFFFSFYCIYIRWWMFTKPIVIIISNHHLYSDVQGLAQIMPLFLLQNLLLQNHKHVIL